MFHQLNPNQLSNYQLVTSSSHMLINDFTILCDQENQL